MARVCRFIPFLELAMNPFTESTVARPLSEDIQAQSPAQSNTLPQPGADTSSGTSEAIAPSGAPHAARRSLFQTLGQRLKGRAVSAASARMVFALGLGLAASGLAYAVDVNTATADQLRAVRGIGPKTAQLIIEERTRGGKYESFDDFSERVKGIGPKKSVALQASGLTVGGAASTAAAGSSASTRAAPAVSARASRPGAK